MLLKLAFQDYIAFIKKNKLLFALVSLGLFAISFISVFLFDDIRDDKLENIQYDGNHSFMYVYDEPISSKELYKKLRVLDSSIYMIQAVSEKAHCNSPDTTYEILERKADSYYTGSAPDTEELGLVGIRYSRMSLKAIRLMEGRHFSSIDDGKMVAVINSGFSYLTDNNKISAEGYEFEILGRSLNNFGRYYYDKNSIQIPFKTFADLDIKVKAVRISFYIPPTKLYLNVMTDILDSFGANVNSNENMGTFSFSIILQILPSMAQHIVTMGFVVLILVLVFKCWISSQQSTYKIYSICGISDKKTYLLRYIQVFLLFTPMFCLASFVYTALIFSNYRTVVYNIIPHTFVFNFVVLFGILLILTFIQNRKNVGFEALKDL